MTLKTLSAKAAAALDKELMSTGAFSIDQLMELAGLSVSQAARQCRQLPAFPACVFSFLFLAASLAPISRGSGADLAPVDIRPPPSLTEAKVYRVHPPSKGRCVLVACGPGNNGGDGLVAARHLCHYGYQPSIYYPKRSKSDLYQRLSKQLEDLDISFVDDFPEALKSADHVVDAIFGFSFSGEVREPFPAVIKALEETKVPVTSVDAPSSWNIEDGPPASGVGSKFHPAVLVSLTAPKPLANHFKGRHFIGGRFVAPSIAVKYDFEVPRYEGMDQVVEVGSVERL